MRKLDLKDKCIHKYIYVLKYIYIYIIWKESMIIIIDLSEGTRRRQKRKRE
jgi:hypothetical protein